MSDRRKRDEDEANEYRFKERHGWFRGARVRGPGAAARPTTPPPKPRSKP